MVRRTRSLAEQHPVEADPRPVPPFDGRRHRHGLFAGVLDIHFEVVLQVLANTGDVGDDVDAQGLELAGIADAREL